MVFPDAPAGVMLPKSRALGFHHKIITLVMAGLSFEAVDALLNCHRTKEQGYGDDAPWESFEQAYKKRYEVFSQILLPLGFEVGESWEQFVARTSYESPQQLAAEFEAMEIMEIEAGEYDEYILTDEDEEI